MPQFLVAIQHLNEYQLPAGAEGEAMMREIGALNREMMAAGVRDFAGGLQPVGKARTVRKQSSGDIVVSDGRFLEAKEHVGGIWLLKCADIDEAVAWARKAAVACRVPVEVREFQELPAKWRAGESADR